MGSEVPSVEDNLNRSDVKCRGSVINRNGMRVSARLLGLLMRMCHIRETVLVRNS